MTTPNQALRAIALYLPQFHPIPENDLWWGKGFTEWTNVTKARPLFPGHYQPHLPADLGFYDLRLPEVQEEQAQLARQYGIHGFCYYHYWLEGRRLLHRPLDGILQSGQPRFPFCLCWANHNWTRNWDDGNRELLARQGYSISDHLDHIRWLAKVFVDERYIRVDDKPLFIFFRASEIPQIRGVTELWREECYKLGVGEIFLAELESQASLERIDPARKGLDAAIEFQPDFHELFSSPRHGVNQEALKATQRQSPDSGPAIFDYATVVEEMLEKPVPPWRYYRCATPSWDNTARKNRQAILLHGNDPTLYEGWLTALVERERERTEGDQLVFLNAWNEWAEGSHLEPCREYGRAWLEATRRALGDSISTIHTNEEKHARLLEKCH